MLGRLSESRVFSACMGALLLTPMLVIGHVHEVEHEGFVEHVEVPHGSHALERAEVDDRMPSPVVDFTIAAAVVGQAVGLDGAAHLRSARVSGQKLRRPARGPPSLHQSRAPPSLI